MKFKMIPVKNQKFEIGRTINFTKCDCKECNFMSCPKNNYCLKMTQKKYTVKEFFNENKEDMLKYSSLYKWFKSDNIDLVGDFLDACICFPKGTYWKLELFSDDIELVKQNRSNYGEDFVTLAQINIDPDMPINYFTGCTNVQERLAEKIQKRLKQLENLFMENRKNED